MRTTPPTDPKKWPRLYLDVPVSAGADLELSADQVHYITTVMRRRDGAAIRVFNGRDGEWATTVRQTGKKTAVLEVGDQLCPQPAASAPARLLFAPIKKARMDILIEKAVELGVTDLYPVMTNNTEVRDTKPERVQAQIIEAAEQCERLDLPRLHPQVALEKLPVLWGHSTVHVGLERQNDTPLLQSLLPELADFAVLIGPEGGFTAEEGRFIRQNQPFSAVSLGDGILRSETAALYALSLWRGRKGGGQ